MKIRKARALDGNKCLTLSWQEGEKYWRENDFKDSIGDSDVEFYIAEEKGKIVGYCLGFIVPTKRTEALIHETRVDTNKRGNDIGTMLVGQVTDALFKRGVRIVYAMIKRQLMPFYCKACKFKETGKWIEVSRKRR